MTKRTKDSSREVFRTWLRLMRFHKPRALLLGLTIFFMALTALFSGLSLATIVPFTDIVLRSHASQDSTATPTPPAVASELGSSETPWPGSAGAEPAPARGFSLHALRTRAEARFQALVRGPTPMETLARFCVAVILLFLLKNLFWYAQSFLSVHIEQTVIRDIRNQLFRHYEALSLDYFQGSHSGVLVSRITNDADLVRGAVANGMMELTREVFTLLTCLVLVLVANTRLFLWAILILTPSLFFVDRIGQVLRRISRVSQDMMARVTSVVGETVRGIRIVKAFGVESHQSARFMRETGDYCRTLVRMTRIGSLGTPLTEMVGAGVAMVLLYTGGRRIILEGAPPGYLLLFLAAFLSMIQPIKAIHQLNIRVQQGLAAGRRIFDVLDSVPTVRPPVVPRRISRFTHELRFDDVWFEYERGTPVLRGIDVAIPCGKIVALVGPSGGGKSTLINLVPRFYDPVRGRVTLDGIDLRELDLDDLRALIGIVTQETILFHDTVANNIRLGRVAAGPTEIEAAARLANAHDFISRLPQGYDTLIGERGLRLSGGERQRLTIARAVLKNPPLLILDEATSALDTEAERLVQGAIDNLLAQRTAVMIAHRLSTVRHADLILTLEGGRIVEAGTHEELLNRRALYYRLYQMQFAEPEPQTSSRKAPIAR